MKVNAASIHLYTGQQSTGKFTKHNTDQRSRNTMVKGYIVTVIFTAYIPGLPVQMYKYNVIFD